MISDRAKRMAEAAPPYYQFSRIYADIQQVQGSEYDSVDAKNKDLRNQLYIVTATWGLKYWESALHIPIVETDGYEIRRSRVLSAWRGNGNFSAELIKSVCEAYSNGEVAVTFDSAASIVIIRFIGAIGLPPNLDDLKESVENIIHAHLGTTYVFSFLTIDQVQAMTINELQTHVMTDFAPFIN